MSKPPSTVKECIIELIHVIDESQHMSDEEKVILMDAIRTSLYAFIKLKEWISE
jgi:hypothetical protein